MKLLKVDTINEVEEKLESYFGDERLCHGTEKVPLRRAVGRYLGESIFADMDVPQFTRSVVDGYAVFGKDTFGVSDSTPVFLDVLGAVEMGKNCDISISPGQTVYVPTGAMLPHGADGVVMVEYAENLDEKTVAIYKAAPPNSGIMLKGDDFKEGQLIYSKGHRVTVKDIGMLAAMGKSELEVFKKPTISILSTGDEIVDVHENPQMGQVRDINSYTIAAFAEQTGAFVENIVRIKDKESLLSEGLKNALVQSDIVILSGGSSAGKKDLTADIVNIAGNPGVITHGIAMKPGKPTVIGVIENQGKSPKLVVGLPGHPMAAIMVYDVIVNHFIKKYYFKNQEEPLKLTATVSENVHSGEGRETYQLVSLKKAYNQDNQEGNIGWIAEPIHGKSGSISQLLRADGYIKIPPLSEGLRIGQMSEVTLIGKIL